MTTGDSGNRCDLPKGMLRLQNRATFRYATWLTAGYLFVGSTYILVSSRFAAAVANDLLELEYIEHVKGIVFVAVTGALLWGVSLGLFRRLAQAHESHALERRALTLVHSKAYAAELAAAVAHDFNNLLMVIHAGLDEMAESDVRRPDPAMLEAMNKAVLSAQALTSRMARAARGERSSRREVYCLSDLVDDTVGLLRRMPRLRDREIQIVSNSRGIVLLDAVLVEQILVNLLLNASDAVGRNGRIRVDVTEDDTHVSLDVHDNGAGVPDSMLQGVFEPFSSTKETGLGLGLLSVRASVDASEGKLSVYRSPMGGAQFQVRWPKAPANQPAQ